MNNLKDLRMLNRLMSICTFLCIQFFLANSIYGQSGPFLLKSSKEIPVGKNSLCSVGYGDTGIIHLSQWDKSTYLFQKFSSDLKLQTEKTIVISELFGKHTEFRDFVKLKNKSYFFVSEVYKKEDCEGISAIQFSAEDLDFEGSAKNLFKTSGSIRYHVEDVYDLKQPQKRQVILDNNPSYEFLVSNNRTKFMYYYSLKPKSKIDAKNKEVIGFQVFDEDLKKLWGGDFEMPYSEKKMDNLEYLLTDDGKVYMVARVFSDGSDRNEVNGKVNYSYEIFMFEQGKQTPQVVKMEIENNFLLTTSLIRFGNNDVIVAGFYGNESQYGGPARGVYVMKPDFSETLGKRNVSFVEFPKEVVDTFLGLTKEKNLVYYGIHYLEIRKILHLADKSIYLIGEKHYSLSFQDDSKSYAFGIYPIKINSSGEIEWIKLLPKKQFSPSGDTRILSFNALAIDNTVHIFYLNEKNVIRTFNLNSDGTFKEYNFTDTRKYDTYFSLRYFNDGLDHKNKLLGTCIKSSKLLLFSIRLN